MTSSVTDQDRGLLYFASLSVKCILDASQEIKQSKENNWIFPVVNCHSIARLIYSFDKENLRLVDGYIIGIKKLNYSEGDITLQQTRHSWLVTPDNAIIDPWPMGIVSPGNALLLPTQENGYNAHGSSLYIEDAKVRDHFDARSSWRTVSSIKRILREYHSKNENSIEEACKIIEELF
jgi:hypothetical protein